MEDPGSQAAQPLEARRSTVLIVDDDPGIRRLVQHFVEAEGCIAQEMATAEEALGKVDSIRPSVLFLDWQEAGSGGLASLSRFSAQMPSLPIIMLTADGSTEAALEARKAGAFECLVKPLDQASLRVALRAALYLSQERRQRQDLEDTLGQIATQSSFPEILSCSPAMKPVFRLMERVLDRDITILIQGESGTGKEMVAQAIHAHGKRSKGAFVVLNCAALPENLVESELFGHEKGAFTGATASRAGHIEMADNGTLFLDEVGVMPLSIQPKFLRCLQDKKVQRVGGGQIRQVDFRLIAATNSDLMQGVVKNEFREDLFYRLAVYPIKLPPLRERSEDILMLLRHFLKHAGRKRVWIEPQAAELLESYSWPGNVRELQNFAARLSVILETDRLTREMVAEQLASTGSQQGVGIPSQFTFTAETRTDGAGTGPEALPVEMAGVSEDDIPRAAESRERQAEVIGAASVAGAPPLNATPDIPVDMGGAWARAVAARHAAPSEPRWPVIESLSPPSVDIPRREPAPATPSAVETPPPAPEEILPMEEVERRTILRALQAFRGNVTETAKALGIGRATLYRYIRKHNLGGDAEKEGKDMPEEGGAGESGEMKVES